MESDYHEKCSQRLFNSKKPPILDYSLEEINELAKEVIKKRIAIPGVQPKLSLTFDKANASERRLTIIGLWDGLYVLKPSNPRFPELPQNEDVTMHMATLVGLKTADHSLIKFRTGELAYISTRFDRKIRRRKLIKLHQEDMCQLTGLLTEDKYNSSMEKVAKAVNTYTTNKGLELLELFQTIIFTFLTGNSDMHLKNFSLVYKEDKTVGLSPAYDHLSTKLIVPSDNEELALTVNGKKSRLSFDDFFKYALYCKISLKAFENILENFENKLPQIGKLISVSFLSNEMAHNYLELIESRAKRLNLTIPDNFSSLDREGGS